VRRFRDRVIRPPEVTTEQPMPVRSPLIPVGDTSRQPATWARVGAC